MTDRTPEQQLAEVIRRGDLLHGVELVKTRSNRIAAAIVAAVNSGDIDPIVPNGKVAVSAEIGNRSVLAIEEMLRITRDTLKAQAELREPSDD